MRAAIVRERAVLVPKSRNLRLPQRKSRASLHTLTDTNRLSVSFSRISTSWNSDACRKLSFRAAFASEAEKKEYNLPLSERIPCPYTQGSHLSLSYTCDTIPDAPVVVEILKVFMPFTCSQVLLVRPVSISSPSICLPDRFILKMADIRFRPRPGTYEEEYPGYAWTYETREAFAEGVRRVRECEWGNEWGDYFPDGRPYYPEEPQAGDDNNADITHFYHEMNHYCSVQACYDREERAYRALQHLQGRDIPHLFGTVSLATGDPEPFLSSVRGLALEHIDGVSLEHFTLEKNITPEQAEGVAQATFRAVRRIRDSFVTHGDLYMRNMMLRRTTRGSVHFDFEHPVIIDFGLGEVWSLDEDDYDDLRDNLSRTVWEARLTFCYDDWHKPSLYLGVYRPDEYTGYARPNHLIDHMPDPKMRARNFEEIPVAERKGPQEVVDEDGVVHIYEPARWRVRPGVRSKDADQDWHPPRR